MQLHGTYAYIAPELYHEQAFDHLALDIYSYAIVAWEVCQRAVTGAYAAPYTSEHKIRQPFQVMLLAAQYVSQPNARRKCVFCSLFPVCSRRTCGRRFRPTCPNR